MTDKTLRKRAEKTVGERAENAEIGSLAYELSVYQIELEMQNDELRKTTANLEAERERYHRMFDASPIAYLVASPSGAIIRANRAARTLLGGGVEGAQLSSFVCSEDIPAFTLYMRDMVENPARRDIALVLETREHKRVPVRFEAVVDPDGDVQIAIVEIGLERELRKQSQYATKLRDIAGVIILSLDARGRILHYNRFMEELSGIPIDDARGTSWIDAFVPKSDRESARATLAQIVRARRPVKRAPSPIETADGERIIQWTGTPLEDADGVVTEILYVGVDITEVVQSQADIRAERERSRAILENASDGIITIDEDGAIETFNPGAERLFGWTAAEAVGMNINAMMPAALIELERDRASDELGGAESLLGTGRELQGLRRDGSVFPLHLSVCEICVDSRLSFCGFVRDLTRARQTEARLRQAHKLEAVGTLASGVAHDFNNLLMGVAGCADVALNRLAPDSDVRPFIEEIRRSAKSGAAITKQLLAFTRKNELETTVFELNEVIEKAEDMLRRLLGEDIEIALDLRAPDSRIRADVGQIEQVLMNLTVNARDAMAATSAGGSLSIETDCVRVGGKSYVALQVADTGEGMTDEVRARVFDPFFSTKPSDRGTGLGLSVVYGIVTQAGGTIQVNSELGKGTTFEVLLPRASERITQDLPVTTGIEANPGRDVSVLVAEDDPTVRLALRHYLETAGYGVIEATTGLEAIERIENATGMIDLLLTDMVLPGRSGVSVARRLGEKMPDARVLFMSAHSAEWLVEHGRLEAGVKPLHKPFGQAELLAQIERVLSQPPAVRRGTVLLADDDVSVRRTLGTGLRDLGYNVLEAADGTEALKLGQLHREKIDALVVDAVLPKRMGVAVASELARDIPGLLVIYISGYARSVALQEDLVGESCLFIGKPVSAAEIHHLIRGATAALAMPPGTRSVLVVEDNISARLALTDLLKDAGLDVVAARSRAEALERLNRRPYDVLLVDYMLPDTTGDRLAAEIREVLPEISVVYMSGFAGLHLKPDGLHFVKPLDFDRLKTAVLGLAAAHDRTSARRRHAPSSQPPPAE